jgi:hypothetical protein
MKNKVSAFMPFADAYYWTATERKHLSDTSDPSAAYMVHMSGSPAGDAGNTPNITKAHKAHVRCIKEETP